MTLGSHLLSCHIMCLCVQVCYVLELECSPNLLYPPHTSPQPFTLGDHVIPSRSALLSRIARGLALSLYSSLFLIKLCIYYKCRHVYLTHKHSNSQKTRTLSYIDLLYKLSGMGQVLKVDTCLSKCLASDLVCLVLGYIQ